MTIKLFNELIENRLIYCLNLLRGEKQQKYAKDDDRLSHFKITGRIKNETQERGLWGMWVKQITSLLDIIENLEKDPPLLPSKEMLDELISDNINYPILLEGLIIERISGETLPTQK
jgi:hypothetical protein